MNKYTINSNWHFTKDTVQVKPDTTVLSAGTWEAFTLPHTWNGIDGQDGGNDYYRGTCTYARSIRREEFGTGEICYLELEGANASASIYVNGQKVGSHDGGYSSWRVNVTEFLAEENELVIEVDNSVTDRVYPQQADFTFYGGLYRNVNAISVEKAHFDLDYFGGSAVKVTPVVSGTDAEVTVEVFLTGCVGGETLEYILMDGDEPIASIVQEADGKGSDQAVFSIKNVHLWNGRKDPHLYTANVLLKKEEQILDERKTRFGCRTFAIDPEEGFFLNGVSYPLRGVSRHQDRPQIGNALLKEHHEEDIDLILEMGANTIRLAHYQHDQYFYDLCDEKGLVIWAEIPYISKHMPNGRENTVSQMTELIVQNYNHPSIVVWGLSNEITMGGANDPDLIENHLILNDLCHRMDPTRKTTIAAITMCSIDAEYIQIPDVVSYNHYYGWYGGDTSMNGPFFDKFHAKYPNIPIGMSEYGCEALNWHTSKPEQGDYTEEYQAYYHEELIKQLFTRKFIWATHVWNMFDFAADARAEGGVDGMNHKGLITFDRQYKKDSFYAYKAWLSDDPFVHICGKRYVDRVEDVTRVTVYSNLPEVELFVNGQSLGKKRSAEHFFYYDVPNAGESILTAQAGAVDFQAKTHIKGQTQTDGICTDESRIRKVEVFNEDYRMKEAGDVINWFEIDMPEGYLNINDKLGEVLKTIRGKLFLAYFLRMLMKGMKKKEKNGKKSTGGGVSIDFRNKEIIQMACGFSIKRIVSMIGTAGVDPLSKEQILDLNRRLNKIRRKD